MIKSNKASVYSAYLIALFISDPLINFIDMFSVPLPRYVAGFSWSVIFGVAALLVMWPSLQNHNSVYLNKFHIKLILVLLFWVLLEYYHVVFNGSAAIDISLISSFLPVIFAFQLVRLHTFLFESHLLLVRIFLYVAIVILILHLLLLKTIGFTTNYFSFINPSEIIDRNSLSIFFVATVFIAVVINPIEYLKISYSNVMIFILVFLHVYVNNSRAASLLLLFTIAYGLFKKNNTIYSFICKKSLFVVISIIALVSFSFPIMQNFLGMHWFGAGDSLLSTRSRSESNWMLLLSFIENPIYGIGLNSVNQIRSLGYVSHSLYLIIISAYGVLGVLPMLIMGWSVFTRMNDDMKTRLSFFMIFITITASFSNDLWLWYGLMFSLAISVVPTKHRM